MKKLLSIPMSKIRADADVQARANFSEATAEDYAELVRAKIERANGHPVVFHDGKDYWLADGFHWRRAHELTGCAHMLCEVKEGGKREAVLYSVGANDTHGLRRTAEDRRHAVLKLLKDAEWKEWSNRQIAEVCRVSEFMVRTRRHELSAIESQTPKEKPAVKFKRGGKTHTMKPAKGRKRDYNGSILGHLSHIAEHARATRDDFRHKPDVADAADDHIDEILDRVDRLEELAKQSSEDERQAA